MGLGLAALGRPGYINLGHGADLGHDYDACAMEDNSHEVLDAAWAAGIRYFDAARSYGRAEKFLASWLASRQILPDEVTIGSKWGYRYTAGWKVQAEKHEIKEHSLAQLQRQFKESRGLLGDYLNVYQIHSATLESGVLDNRDVLRELAALRDSGIAVGLSLSGASQPEVLRKALGTHIDGRPLFASVQATWNLLEPSSGPALAEAADMGLAVIVKEALANGRLTRRNDEADFGERLKLLERTANDLDTSVDALALAAVLAQPWAAVVLSGAATADQLRSNVAALNVAWDDDVAMRLQALAEPPERYWRKRNQLAWN